MSYPASASGAFKVVGLKTAAAAAALCFFATGCGNDTDTVEEAPQAAETTARADETTTTTATTTTAQAPAEDLSPVDLLLGSIEATASRSARGQTRIEGAMVEASGESLSVDFQVDAEGDVEAMLADSGDPSAPAPTIRIVDGQTYAGLPGAFAQQMFPDFGGETAWLTVGPEFAEQFAVACASPLAILKTDSAGCDPAADLRSLADDAKEAEVLGDEELRGVPTTRIRFAVPFADLLSAGDSEGVLGGGLGGSLEGSLPIDAWIDDDMLLRKLTVDLSGIFSGLAEAFGAEDDQDVDIPGWQTVIEYFDFDDSISIEAPAPESLVGDFAQLQGLVG